MASIDRVFLIGLSGSGKSTVAKLAAELLGWTANDSDAEIANQNGRSIADIFSKDGEESFRELECALVQTMSSQSNQVLALGGGAFTDATNRCILLKRGLVVWLDVDPTEAAERLDTSLHHEPRPLLQDDPVAHLFRLRAKRLPQYEQADLRINTAGLTAYEVAEKVVSAAEMTATAANAQ